MPVNRSTLAELQNQINILESANKQQEAEYAQYRERTIKRTVELRQRIINLNKIRSHSYLPFWRRKQLAKELADVQSPNN